MYHCYNCNSPIAVSDKPGRSETCPECDADLHCCRNCTLYDPRVYNECRESQAERVVDKERSNFCDYFCWPKDADSPASTAPRPKIMPKKVRSVEPKPMKPPQKARRANPLDSLFKKST